LVPQYEVFQQLIHAYTRIQVPDFHILEAFQMENNYVDSILLTRTPQQPNRMSL